MGGRGTLPLSMNGGAWGGGWGGLPGFGVPLGPLNKPGPGIPEGPPAPLGRERFTKLLERCGIPFIILGGIPVCGP